MDDATKLKMTKINLQLLSSSYDEYLRSLLEKAKLLIKREGVDIEQDKDEVDLVEIEYAAYLFRSRASNDTETHMPRFLRWQINNILLDQKGVIKDEEEEQEDGGDNQKETDNNTYEGSGDESNTTDGTGEANG